MPRAVGHAVRMNRTTPIIGIVTSGVLTLMALVVLAAGGALLWASDHKTDNDGYYSTAKHHYTTSTHALVTENLDLGSDTPRWVFGSDRLGKLRVEATSSKPLFIGVGRSDNVRAYLDRVERDEITDLDFSPFKADYRRLSGNRSPERPSEQEIWAATGVQKIDWNVRKGDWSIVIMNRDGSRGVDVQAKAGANAPFIRTLGWILLLPGAAVTVAGLGAMALSARGLVRAGGRDVAPQPAG